MKLKRYLFAVAAALLLLGGCSSDSGEPGRVERISSATVAEKKNNQEDFAIVLTQTGCGHCTTFHNMLDKYLPDHNVVVYEVMLDWENDKKGAQKTLNDLEAIFPDFNGTPDLYYIEKGEIKSRFWDEPEAESEGLSEDSFHQWVKKYQLLDREESSL